MKIKFIILFISLFCWLFVFSKAQYFQFTWSSDNWFQAWCNEEYDIYFDTEWITGITTAQALVLLDYNKIIYYTWQNLWLLRTNLFDLYTSSSAWMVSWVSWFPMRDIQFNQIYLVGQNPDDESVSWYNKFGSLKFVPKYSTRKLDFVFVYWWGNETVLNTEYWNQINPISQNQHLTWTIQVEQKPCLEDTVNPSIQDNNYSNLSTKVTNIGIDLDLTDASNQWDVPYVWHNGTWTWNAWGITNQYGIDQSTISVTVAGNDDSVVLWQNDFVWTPSNKTWQDEDRDDRVVASPSKLFDFGVEKRINVYYTIKDRVGNTKTNYLSFNHPKNPVISNIQPSDNRTYVDLMDIVSFKLSDDWAGIDSGSVILTLSWLDNDFYGQYSGDLLNFSDVAWVANTPDYIVSLINHNQFSASGTIQASVYALDNEENGGVLDTWQFTARPDCVELGCCDRMIQTWDETTREYYPNSTIYISGGNNASFTGIWNETWYIDCNTENEWLSIYNGHWNNNTGILVWFTDLTELNFSGINVKAVLSGNTVLLTRINITPPNTGWWGWGGAWWGWVKLERDDCPDGDASFSYYDGTCGWHTSADFCAVDQSNYSSELKWAYIYSYMYGITTMCPIQDADIDWYLQRNHFAKMISEFAVNVLWKEPNIGKTWCNEYNDTYWDTEELQWFVTTACELNLMWLNSDGITPAPSFNGGDYVTRAQFGTVFSRLLFGDKYNVSDESDIYQQEWYWYKDHLEALKENWIMTKIDGNWPNMLELRWYVMLMMQRADNYGVFAGVIPALNWANALFD